MTASTIKNLSEAENAAKAGTRPRNFVTSIEVEKMFDEYPVNEAKPVASALLLFDRAMKIRAISADIVAAAQELNRMSDHELSELGINRSDIEDTIERYI